MNKKIFIYGIVFIVLISFVYAYTLNTFSDGSSTDYVIFTEAGSKYFNLTIPYWASITTSTINLEGLNEFSIDEETFSNATNKTGEPCIWYNPVTFVFDENQWELTVDENQSSYSMLYQATADYSCIIYETFEYKYNLNNSLYVSKADHDDSDVDFIRSFYNYTSSKWDNRTVEVLQVDAPKNYSLNISSDWINGSNIIQVKTYISTRGGAFLDGLRYYEGFIRYNSTFPENITIRSNNEITYQNLSIFNRTVTNIDLNISSLQSCVNSVSSGNATCTLNLTSATAGILEYSNIDIEYDDFSLDNCSNNSIVVLNITGKDEETDGYVNMSLNIYMYPSLGYETSMNLTYELRGKSSYTFCSKINTTDLRVDSIMEYGGGNTYTDRKYYLNNFSIDTSTVNDVYLYHLNNSKASEIVFTVFDTTTGDKVPGAYIKILRYYPGENVYRTVEIAKTDEVGESLGKMVLADVFYKFIIEIPAGTVKLTTDVLRILSLTRSFGISFVENYLDTWNKIHDVSYSTTCTKSTQTCRVTWSDSSNTVKSVTLEIWRTNGITDELLSTQTTASAAGTISYTIVEATDGNDYTAKAFAKSNPDWSFGYASLPFPDSPFFTNETHRLASLFPLFLLVIVIVFALIDWGAIGITIGSLLGLIIGSVTGILPIDIYYLISFILLAVILIYKLSK